MKGSASYADDSLGLVAASGRCRCVSRCYLVDRRRWRFPLTRLLANHAACRRVISASAIRPVSVSEYGA
jgi:hypothetical protein